MSKFNFNIDIENTESPLYKSKNNSVSQKQAYEDSIMVDLDLPSGNLWAKYNLNATHNNSKESWYGDYFAWAETSPKSKYLWTTYKHASSQYAIFHYCSSSDSLSWKGITVYPDDILTLQKKDDAATQILGDMWKTPTIEDFTELKHLEKRYVVNYNDIYGLCGLIFIGNNGNELFMPFSGFESGKELFMPFSGFESGNTKTMSTGSYWINEIVKYQSYRAYYMQIYMQGNKIIYLEREMMYRFVGLPIRPVSNKKYFSNEQV